MLQPTAHKLSNGNTSLFTAHITRLLQKSHGRREAFYWVGNIKLPFQQNHEPFLANSSSNTAAIRINAKPLDATYLQSMQTCIRPARWSLLVWVAFCRYEFKRQAVKAVPANTTMTNQRKLRVATPLKMSKLWHVLDCKFPDRRLQVAFFSAALGVKQKPYILIHDSTQ